MPRVGKRRRNLLDSSSPPSKRQRVEEYNPEQQWEALAIVSEETAKYLVKWTDIDPATGELYEPTWEKKEDVGPGLIEGWERRHKSVHRPRQNVLLSSDSVEEIQESEQSLLEQTQEEVAFNVPQVIPPQFTTSQLDKYSTIGSSQLQSSRSVHVLTDTQTTTTSKSQADHDSAIGSEEPQTPDFIESNQRSDRLSDRQPGFFRSVESVDEVAPLSVLLPQSDAVATLSSQEILVAREDSPLFFPAPSSPPEESRIENVLPVQADPRVQEQSDCLRASRNSSSRSDSVSFAGATQHPTSALSQPLLSNFVPYSTVSHRPPSSTSASSTDSIRADGSLTIRQKFHQLREKQSQLRQSSIHSVIMQSSVEKSARLRSTASPQPSTQTDLRERLRQARQNGAARATPGTVDHAVNAGKNSNSIQQDDIPSIANRERSVPLITQMSPLALEQTQSKVSSPSLLKALPNGIATPTVDMVEPALTPTVAPARNVFNVALGASALPMSQLPILEQPSESQGQAQNGDDNITASPTSNLHDFLIPLPCEGRTKSDYLSWLRSAEFLAPILRGTKITADDMQNCQELIQNLNDTCTHTDLAIDGPMTQASSPDEANAAWAEIAGPKFAFLGHLLDGFRNDDCCIAIMVSGDRIYELVANYLKGKKIWFHKIAEPILSEDVPRMEVKVLLADSDDEMHPTIQIHPRIIIAFDRTLTARDSAVKTIRAKAIDGPMALLRPVILKSSEHICASLDGDIGTPSIMRHLLRNVVSHANDIGGIMSTTESIRQMHALSPKERLYAVRQVMLSSMSDICNKIIDASRNGPLPLDFQIEVPDLDIELDESIESESELLQAPAAIDRTTSSTPSGYKRLRDDDAQSSPKRQRLTPLPEITHITDSGSESSQAVQVLQSQLAALRDELSIERAARLVSDDALEKMNADLQEVILDRRTLQTRFESRTKERHALRQANARLETAAAAALLAAEKRELLLTAIKEQKATLLVDLKQAREDLKNAGSDIAALESAKEEARITKSEALKYQKTLANTQKENEWFKEQYNSAMSQGREHLARVEQLEAEAETLKQEASDEQRRLKEVNYRFEIKQANNKIDQAKAEVEDLKKLMAKKEEEVQQLRKGRAMGVQTRGSSAQPASRGGSPAPGFGHQHNLSGGGGGHPGNRVAGLRAER